LTQSIQNQIAGEVSMKAIAYLLIFCIVTGYGCAPAQFKPYVPPKTEFAKTPDYSIKKELEDLPKPTPIVRQYIKIRGNSFTVVTDPAQADMVLMSFDEFKKVGALKDLAIAYKEVALGQEVLINNYIAIENSLKELAVVKDNMVQQYATMYANSENLYLQEKYEHGKDNTINKVFFWLGTFGAAIVTGLVLKAPVH
jgi:hypothetical protein